MISNLERVLRLAMVLSHVFRPVLLAFASQIVQRCWYGLRLRYSARDLLGGEKWREGAQHELRLSELLAGACESHQICE